MGVNSISGVSFGRSGVMRHDDPISKEELFSPGAYPADSINLSNAQPEHKKGSFLGGVFKLVLTAAVIAGGAVAARKLIPALGEGKISEDFVNNIGSKLKGKEKVGFADKAKYYFAKSTDWLVKNTYTRVETYVNKHKTKAPETATTQTPNQPPAGDTGAQGVNAKA